MQTPTPPPQPILPLHLSASRMLRIDGEPITSNDCGTQLRFHHADDPFTFYSTFFFHLNSLVHSCLNLFHSAAVKTDLQVAAELNWGRVASHPVHMPTREARGRDTQHQTTLASMRVDPEFFFKKRKKQITNKWTGRLCRSRYPHVMQANSDWIILNTIFLIRTMFVVINF